MCKKCSFICGNFNSKLLSVDTRQHYNFYARMTAKNNFTKTLQN